MSAAAWNSCRQCVVHITLRIRVLACVDARIVSRTDELLRCRIPRAHVLPGNSSMRLLAVRGFTLLELMAAIAVLGILLGIGVPAFREMLAANRLTSVANEMV